MKALEWCQWHRSSVFIVKSEHTLNFIMTVDFEQANVYWVHIDKTNTFEGKDPIYHGLCCSILSVNKIY